MTLATAAGESFTEFAKARGILPNVGIAGGERETAAKRLAISLVLGGLAVAFLGVFGLGALREVGGSNSYALLADAWLNGRLDVDACFDLDCALFEGRNYIIFPPAPAVITLPFVALFGVDFRFFMPLSLLAFAASGFLWWRIAERLTAERDLSVLLVLVTLFATPLAFVALRGDHVWFFAQIWGFLFSTAALYAALIGRSALLAGLFIGLAFLSRQMTILYGPFLYVLLLDPRRPLLRLDGEAVRRAMSLALFPAIAVAIYLAYNYARFGSPLETGYSYIFLTDQFGADAPGSEFLTHRVREVGIFSADYFLFNAIYMFIAGPHVEFAGRYMTQLSGFDVNGASLFLVAPVLLLAFLARWERSFWIGLGTCALILGLTLFYHSNGFSQYSAQRYALDWLPILLVFLARGMRPAHAGALSVLVAYSMAVTLGMIVVGGVLAG